jgi:hypothetical protein
LKELEQAVVSVLTLAVSYGRTHIITNAETGWVQLSAQVWSSNPLSPFEFCAYASSFAFFPSFFLLFLQKFIPGVLPLLNKVVVHSARSTYESMFPQNPLKWKFYAFQEKLNATFADSKSEKNVVSFGDSHVEREAVRAVTKTFTNTRTKSVKFAERPSMEQLRRQLDLVVNCFKYILTHDGDLDLQLTISNNNQQQQSTTTTQQTTTTSTTTQQQQVQKQEVQQKEKEDKKDIIPSTSSSSTSTKSTSTSSPQSHPMDTTDSCHPTPSFRGPLFTPSPITQRA